MKNPFLKNSVWTFCGYCNVKFNVWNVPLWAWNGLFLKSIDCPDCNGTGTNNYGYCVTCFGIGGVDNQPKLFKKLSFGHLSKKLVEWHVKKCCKKHNGILYVYKKDAIDAVDRFVATIL